jgi:hypothetical protein
MPAHKNNQKISLCCIRVRALGVERKALQCRALDDFTEACTSQIASEPLLLQGNHKVGMLLRLAF